MNFTSLPRILNNHEVSSKEEIKWKSAWFLFKTVLTSSSFWLIDFPVIFSFNKKALSVGRAGLSIHTLLKRSKSPRTLISFCSNTSFMYLAVAIGANFPSKATVLPLVRDRKSTRLNSSHVKISYAVFCLKKKKKQIRKL